MANNILKKLASQTAIYGLSSIIGRLLNYLLVPLYTRVFAASEYGVVTELYSYVGFLLIIFTYGTETAFFRFIKDAEQPSKVYSTIMVSLLGTSAFFVGLFLLFAVPISELIQYENHVEYIIWFALILGFDALSSIPFAHLRYKEKAWQFAAIKLTNIGLSIGLILFFLKGCPLLAPHSSFIQRFYNPEIGVGYIFISNLIASAVTLFLLLPELIKIKWQFDFELWKKMILYALPLVVAGFAGTINEMLDRVILKYLLPYDLETNMSHLGIYGACYKLSILMTLFTQAYRFAAEPFFFAQSKQGNAKEVYAFAMKFFVVAGSFIFVGIMLFLDIVKYFIDVSYHEGLVIVPILLLANLCLGMYYNLSIWYKLTNKTIIGAYMGILGAVITLILNFLLIPHIGYLGSAWATLVCYATMVLVSYLLSRRYFPIPYAVKNILSYLFIAILIVFLHQQFVNDIENLVLLYALRVSIILLFGTGIIYFERKSFLNY